MCMKYAFKHFAGILNEKDSKRGKIQYLFYMISLRNVIKKFNSLTLCVRVPPTWYCCIHSRISNFFGHNPECHFCHLGNVREFSYQYNNT